MSLVASVIIETKPVGAEIEIDGRPLGTTPLETAAIVGPGDHIVVASLDGKRSQRELRIAAGDSFSVELDFADEEKVYLANGPYVVEKVQEPVKISYPKFIVSGVFVFTLDRFGETGAPGVGLGYLIHPRIALGVDATLVANSVFPNVRIKLVGTKLSVHGVWGAPIAFLDQETELAFAGGLGIRWELSPSFYLRGESMISYRSSATFPVSLGIEARF